MVNPQNQTLIEGESNIARYIQRLLNPDFDRCVVASTKIDEWLDLAEQYVRGNKKENAAVLKSLNSKLGSSEWLVGNSVSLADIVMWSVVNQGKAQKDSPANVKNWLKRCENNVYFDMAKTVL
jgi:aminoacyl tRNA synthase complex-interacting multifunctional protein 2